MHRATGAVLLLLTTTRLAAGLQCGPRQYQQGGRCCSPCPENGRVAAPCSPAADTVCACPAGSWLDRPAGRCRPCSRCRPGTGPSRPCSPHHNTVCGACPAGTFSQPEDDGAGSGCRRCSPCRVDQVNIQNCTARQDTVCMDESFNQLGEEGASGAVTLTTAAAADHWPAENGSSDIPIYCGILGTVIFVLLLYVAIRHWKLRAAPQKSSSPTMATPSAVVVTRPASLSDAPCPQIEPLFSVPLRKRLAEMAANERREIEAQLCNHPTSNWSALAIVLGYSKQQTRQIQEMAAQKKTNPARLLISDWSKRGDATVTSFVHALTVVGRRDLVGLVSPKPFRLTVANVDNFV